MRWKNVGLIFRREVRDQLRDRRTLFMVAVLPLLLYPALAIGFMQMMVMSNEQPRSVVVFGADDLPTEPHRRLIDGLHFAEKHFGTPDEAKSLYVLTDPADVREIKPPDTPPPARIFTQEARIRSLADRQAELEEQRDAWAKAHPQAVAAEQFPGRQELSDVRHRLTELTRGADVVLIIPPDFAENLTAVNRRLAEQSGGTGQPQGEPPDDPEEFRDYPRPQVIVNSADEKSVVAAERVRDVLESWTDDLLQERLQSADLPEHVIDPVAETRLDIAEDRQISALVWSKLFPALLVLMAVTGAFNPAVDLAAGEKERGTMETLLISPAARSEIVLGKFFTVMVFSVSTALLNLVSMGLTSRYLASVAQAGTLSRLGSLEPPSLGALLWVAVLLLPLAALFSALCLALATFARSTKEGQYYLTPLLMVAIGLTLFCLTPLAEIDLLYSLLPVMNVALLLKEVLADPTSSRALTFAVPVMVTSVGYSLLALWWAIEQFAREDVLFREAERFSVRAWLRHLLRDKEPTPSFTEGAICFGLLMLLQFFSLTFMQRALGGASETQGERMLQLVMVQQLALMATPALLMGIMLTTSVRKTFRLMSPRWSVFAVAVVLPFVLHPISMELLSFLEGRLFHRLDPGLQEKLATMLSEPLWLILLGAAVAPAVCEEITFRGFVLSGFSRSGRIWLAIVLSALAFGLIHMIPQQVFNGALLGIVLGLIAVRGGSLLPTVCFHLIWNTLGVLHVRLGTLVDVPALVEAPVLKSLIVLQGDSIGYRWPTLLIGGLVSAALITWLVKQPSDPRALPAADLAPDGASDPGLDVIPPTADRSPVGAS